MEIICKIKHLATHALAALSACLLLSACQLMPNEVAEEAPKARLRVVHADPRLGPVEVLLDEQIVLTVTPGAVSEEAVINVGEWALSFRSQGATQAIVTTEVISFEQHLSVVALTEGEGEARLLLATEPPPAAEDGTHHLRVLDLSGRSAAMRVFHGLAQVLALPVEGRLSAFLAIEPSVTSSAFTLADGETGAPLPSESPSVELAAGGATFLVVQEGGEGPGGFKFAPFSIR